MEIKKILFVIMIIATLFLSGCNSVSDFFSQISGKEPYISQLTADQEFYTSMDDEIKILVKIKNPTDVEYTPKIGFDFPEGVSPVDYQLKNNKPKGSVIGIPFYTEADRQIQFQNSVDDSGFKSYDEMLEHTRKLKNDIESKVYLVKDVPINASAMQEYFEKNELKNNSKNRSSYVADLLRKGERE